MLRARGGLTRNRINVGPNSQPRPRKLPQYVAKHRKKRENGQRKRRPVQPRMKLEEPRTPKSEDVKSKMKSCRVKKVWKVLNQLGNGKRRVVKRAVRRRGVNLRFHPMRSRKL
jgi:hypothetical protein